LKHPIWKNHEAQFSINHILKYEIEKKNFNYTQWFFFKSIKKMRIKIQILNKIYIWLKDEIKKKNNLVKEPKKNKKNKDPKWHKKLKIKFWLKGETEKNNNFSKRSKKKNRN